ncbi:chromate transporter [Paenibacillus selenitireducens]|uniref:Chromate transporter n=1 Tax=Paenibacillus selenitireducens TaxID=1324314 RepID=A0A1T2XN27_9BACL|nr:chromate transporter [Paenibacillus selenitireducens]OPA81222.1 chromate transporter [Paenibacillus selenitireducens]
MNASKASKFKLWLQIFGTFCQIGPSTFGGGYAMIPGIEREVVTKRKWLQASEMSDLVSIAGSAPGGVGVNLAAFIGYRIAGVPGVMMAVAGITLPTFLIVFALSLGYTFFKDNAKIEAALKGIQGGIIALIMIAAYRMAKSAIFDKTTITVSIGALFLLLVTPIHPLYLIIFGFLIGIIAVQIKKALGYTIHTEQVSKHQDDPTPIYPEYYI